MDTTIGYQDLCTEFYDITKPQAGPDEVAFFENMLKDKKGPFLEAMCGSGRLLIPLLKKGYAIDGVDNSSSMLASCKRRCQEAHINSNLFDQSLAELSLPKKYEVIFIAVGSFQLISDRDEALLILKKLREHLMPGGFLLIDTFIPWDCIKPAIRGECYLSPRLYQLTDNKKCFSHNAEINLVQTTTINPQEQLTVTEGRYEKKVDGKIVATEDERLAIRWYYRYEFELFLEKAGFSSVTMHDIVFEHNPQSIVYQATK